MAIGYVGGNSGNHNGSTTLGISLSLTSLTGGSGSTAETGDLVLVAVTKGATANSAPSLTSSGYTQILSSLYSNGSSYDTNLAFWYKFMGSTPDVTVEVAPSGNVARAIAAAVQVFRGVDSTTIFDVTSQSDSGTGTSRPTPPAITPSTSGAIIVCAGGGSASTGSTYTASELSGFETNRGNDTQDAEIGLGYYAWSSGTFTPAQWTGGTTNSVDSWAAYTIALLPQSATNYYKDVGGVLSFGSVGGGGSVSVEQGWVAAYGDSTSTAPATYANVPTEGNLLVVAVSLGSETGDSPAITSVTDNIGDGGSWNIEGPVTQTYWGSFPMPTYILWKQVGTPSGGGKAVSVNYSNGTQYQTNCAEFSNSISGTWELDGSVTSSVDTGTSPSAGSIDTSGSASVLIGALIADDGTATAGSGYTLNTSGTTYVFYCYAEYKITTSSGNYAVDFTDSTSTVYGAIGAAFTIQSSGGGGTLVAVIITIYHKAVSGVLGLAGSVTRTSNRLIAGALSLVGAAQRTTSKLTAGTLSFAGNIRKTILATRSGVLGLSGVLDAIMSGGGTLYYKAIGGSLAMVGAVARTSSRIVSGTLSFTGTIARKGRRAVSGSLAFAGSIGRSAAHHIAGVLAFSGAVLKSGTRGIGGSLAMSSSMLKSGTRGIGGSLAMAGSMRKAVSVVRSGTLAIYGSMLKSAVRGIGGSLAMAGSMRKAVSAVRSGTLTMYGSMRKAVAAMRAGTLGLSGILDAITSGGGNLYHKAVGGALALSGVVGKAAQHGMSGALAFSGNVKKTVQRITVGAMSFVGGSSRAIGRHMHGSLSFFGNAAKKASRMVYGSLPMAGDVVAVLNAIVLEFILRLKSYIVQLFSASSTVHDVVTLADKSTMVTEVNEASNIITTVKEDSIITTSVNLQSTINIEEEEL
jgi:hypothetical protein